MISFPLIPPASPTTSDLKSAANNIVGENVSPFTGSQQIFENQGEWWEGQLALPPLYTRANAEPWLAFLAALRGKSGSFLLGDPNAAVPQGSAARSNVNLLAWSESFDNVSFWGGGGVASITADAVTDPNGFQTAESATANAGASDAFLSQTMQVSIVAGKTVTWSVWLKVPSGTVNINIYLIDNISNSVTTCAVTSSWQRFQVTRTFSGGITSARAQVGAGSSWTNSQVLHMWGGQAELASSASAYIGTSFAGPTGAPQISMNGTTQGPKIILLKGLAPNSVAFKAGDYIECGYGLAATRVSSTGGSSTAKWISPVGASPAVSGQTYVTSVRIRNIGSKAAAVSDDVASQIAVNPGAELAIALVTTGAGSGSLQILLASASSSSDPVDVVVWAPRIQRLGLDENLIPATGLTFETGWSAFGGATVTRTQGYNRRLYKVLSDSTSDAKGNCGVEIFPRWRNGDAVADGDPVNVFSPRGMFRLADNLRSWQLDNALLYQGISLNIKEAF